MPIGGHRELRSSYSFDEISLVPGDVTINPDQVDTTVALGNLSFSVPIFAAAMDAVVDPGFARLFGKLGGAAVLNLEGIYTRYENPSDILAQITEATPDEVTALLSQSLLSQYRLC